MAYPFHFHPDFSIIWSMNTLYQEATADGRVQGVGFRAHCFQWARRLKITGSVANLADGRVHIVAAGPPEQLALFWEMVQQGPPLSRVNPLQIISRNTPIDLDNFEIVF